MPLSKAKQAERQEQIFQARRELERYILPGHTIYLVTRHKSASGIQFAFSFFAVYAASIVDITAEVQQLLGWPWDRKHGGVTVRGGGMDMRWWVVSRISDAMWPGQTDLPKRDAGALNYRSL